ncbi:DNA adenine methylase [Aliiroseovarius sp. Z3]|nr:DNA adenine methylase [Aliiroseovarius sp. Z3]
MRITSVERARTHTHLAGVVIECLDWSDLIRRYDEQDTLFYLDPPYRGCEVDVSYTISKKADARGKRGELLISNFDI